MKRMRSLTAIFLILLLQMPLSAAASTCISQAACCSTSAACECSGCDCRLEIPRESQRDIVAVHVLEAGFELATAASSGVRFSVVEPTLPLRNTPLFQSPAESEFFTHSAFALPPPV